MRYLWVALLAGCMPPARYVVTDVTSMQWPVADALIAADCGLSARAATRTDDLGRARLRLGASFDAARCVLVAAKPGFSTVEVSGVAACTSPTGCQPMEIELAPSPEGAR